MLAQQGAAMLNGAALEASHPGATGDGASVAAQLAALLQAARSHLHQGDAPSALHCVLQALRLKGDQAGVQDAMNRAIQGLQAGSPTTCSVDALSAFLQQLELTTSQGGSPAAGGDHMDTDMQHPGDPTEPASTWAPLSAHHAPILQETGREGLATAAVADGSTYQCQRCGGLVSCSRQQQHELYWCDSLLGSHHAAQ